MPKAVIKYDDEQDPIEGRDVHIIYVSNDRSFSQSYLNVNAFPNNLHKEVSACTSRFAIFHNQLKLLNMQLKSDVDMLEKYLIDPKMELSKVLMRNNNDRYDAKYDGIEVLTYVNSLFHSLKSFLDVYTMLLCHLIDPNQTLSFKRKTVDDESLSGGAFIRWLRNAAPKSFDKATDLADFILKESREWITEAVNHRDSITHYTDIDDINCLSVNLIKISQPSEPMFEKKQVEEPTMPDGMKVREYSLYIGERLRNYVITTISMFSNVKHDLLHHPNFNINEPVWP